MLGVVVAVLVLSTFHLLIGFISMCIGIAASIQADVWLAHSVSPIWSGAFFIITGSLGFVCAKRKTAYMIMCFMAFSMCLKPGVHRGDRIMCFMAFSMVSLVTAIVSIQLLRLGLVNQATDGSVYQKEHKDRLILIALPFAGVECLFCIASSFASCRLAKAAKALLAKKTVGTFYIQDGQYGRHLDLSQEEEENCEDTGVDNVTINCGKDPAQPDAVHIHVHNENATEVDIGLPRDVSTGVAIA